MKTTKFIFSMFALMLCMAPLHSQGDQMLLLSKNGNVILPQKGHFAIGIDANPFFSYAGNLFNFGSGDGYGYNTLRLDLLNSQIYAKYVLSPDKIIRLKFSANNNSGTMENLVIDDSQYIEEIGDAEYVSDINKYSNSYFSICPGFEFRKGNNRLQVLYGGEISFNFQKNTQEITYGNAFASDNTSPTTTTSFYSHYSSPQYSRLLSIEGGATTNLGLRGFVGLEYFFLPRISVGGEIGIAYYRTIKTNATTQTESWDYTNDRVEITTLEQAPASSSSFSTDIMSGRIVVLFYL